MIRKQIYVTEEQEQFLKQQSNKKGMTEAEIVRHALEHYIKMQDDDWIEGFKIGGT